jgi:methionyl-tRNA synthetase
MMKAAGIPLPKTIFADGWWLIDEAKMSKSLQNIVKPLDLIDKYGVDSVRYFLIRDMVLGQDANFSEEMFIRRYNSDLANDFGNLASRILTLIRKNYDNIIPPEIDPGSEEQNLRKNAESLPAKVHNLIDELRLNEAIEVIIAFVRSINRFMEIKAPWKLVKSDLEQAGTVLYTAAEGLRIAAKLLEPVMPGKIDLILNAFPVISNEFAWGNLKNGEPLGKLPILFPRVQTDKPVSAAMKPAEIVKEKEINLITINEFFKAQLVTARVLAAEPIPETTKLLKLQIDTGKDRRQIVAGIAEHYAPEDLIGKTIIVVANLQPTTIRGIKSNGMLLAAKKGKQLKLVTVMDDIAPGSPVG